MLNRVGDLVATLGIGETTGIGGRYDAHHVVGQGNFGRVYRARDLRHPRAADVAIKVVPLADIRAVHSFRSESSTLSRLDHPNIVRVVEVFDDGNNGYIVMEYLPGESLTMELQASRPLPLSRIVSLLSPICDALEYAHRRGIIHRDVSPNNILVTEPDGIPKLIDFGVATVAAARRDVALATIGTPSFMAPEHLRGEANDPRIDLYAVGAILYHLATGQRPIEYRAGDTVDMVLEKKDRLVAELAVDGPLRPLLRSLLSINPASRPGSAREVARTLRELTEPCAAARVSAAEHIQLTNPAEVPPIGRDAVLALLRERLSAASLGKGALVACSGLSGSGKSTVTRHFLHEAQSGGALTLQGNCLEVARGVPYAALREALEDVAELAERSPELRQRVGAAARDREAEVVSLAPWLREIVGETRGVAPPNASQAAFIAEIVQFIARLGRTGAPLVFWIDDVQWADASTLRVLERLAVKCAHQPLLLLITYREDEAAEVERLFQGVDPRQPELRLRPLGADDVALLLPKIFGAPLRDAAAVAALVTRSAEGNPFSIWEVCRGLLDEDVFHRSAEGAIGWDQDRALAALHRVTPADLLGNRIATLDAPLREMLARAAVWGRRFEVRQIGAEPAHLESAERIGLIVREQDGIYTFVHDRVLAAAYAQLSPLDRRRLHAAAGQRLSNASDGASGLTVKHFEQAEDFGAAMDAAVRAGARAEETLAVDAAYAFYCKATEWIDSGKVARPIDQLCQLWQRLGAAALATGRYEEAIAALTRGLNAFATDPGGGRSDVIGRARAYSMQAEASWRLGRVDDAVRLYERAMGTLGVSIPQDGVKLAWFVARQSVIAAWHQLVGRRWLRRRWRDDDRLREAIGQLAGFSHTLFYIDARRALAAHIKVANMADLIGPSAEKARGYAIHGGGVGVSMGRLNRRVEHFGREGVRIARELGDRRTEVKALMLRMIGLWTRGRWTDAHQAIEQIIALSRVVRDASAINVALSYRVALRFRQGDLRGALAAAQEARANADAHAACDLVDALMYIPQPLAALGNIDEAIAVGESSLRTSQRNGGVRQSVCTLAQLSGVYAIKGDWPAARRCAGEGYALARKHRYRTVHSAQLGALYLLALVSQPEGARLSRELLRALGETLLCSQWWELYSACNLWALGHTAAARGAPPLARWLYRRAAAQGARWGTTLDEARARRELGLSLLQRDASDGEGAEALLRALELLERCGAAREHGELLAAFGQQKELSSAAAALDNRQTVCVGREY